MTAVWPPTGIAVAALILWGYKLWPGVYAGALVSNAISGEPLWTAAAIAVGNTAGPLLAAALLRAAAFRATLERARDVLALLATAAASSIVTAGNGVLMLVLAGIVTWHAYASVWLVWWAGDAMGIVVVAPLLLTFFTRPATRDAEPRRVELALLFVAIALVTWMSFVSSLPVRLSVYPLIVWAALRFGQRETIGAIALITAICVWGTAHQLGAFGTGTEDQRLLSVMSFVAVLCATGLLLAATTSELRSANRRLIDAVDTLQAGLLPGALPQRPGARIDGLYLAAGSEALVGGDWYDAFERPDGSIVVSIGDVVGHGLAAAVTAGKLRQAIFTAAFDTADPSEVLERVNRTVAAQWQSIATALVAFFDPSLHRMRYAVAGHPPPIVASPSAPPQQLGYGGLPLGIGDEVRSRTHDVELADGCAVLFYTDGLVEFDRNAVAAEAAAYDALARVVSDGKTPDAAAAVAREVMGSSEPNDDVALVVVRLGR